MQVANVIGTQFGASRYTIGGPTDFPVHALDNAPFGGGRVAATPEVCNQIICGFISQAEAGPDLLYACSQAGHVGARAGCADSMCRSIAAGRCGNVPQVTEPRPTYVQPPTANLFPFEFPPAPPVSAPQALTPPLPSMTPTRRAEMPVANLGGEDYSCGFTGWVDANKGLALLLVVAGYMMVRK